MKTNCIIWKGSIWSQGRYGRDKINGKSMGAHRAAWINKFGEISDGLVVCHKCDNGLCINIDHLFLGTLKDNSQDCIKKGRFKFPIGISKGENNGNARKDYLFIKEKSKEMKSQGYSCKEIKEKLNIKSNGHLYNLLKS